MFFSHIYIVNHSFHTNKVFTQCYKRKEEWIQVYIYIYIYMKKKIQIYIYSIIYCLLFFLSMSRSGRDSRLNTDGGNDTSKAKWLRLVFLTLMQRRPLAHKYRKGKVKSTLHSLLLSAFSYKELAHHTGYHRDWKESEIAYWAFDMNLLAKHSEVTIGQKRLW
jgi:hypothetical protein